jgi:glucarate dehydratase
VSATAAAHVLSTCSNAGLAHQTHYQILDADVIAGGPPSFESGGLALPDGPGIGVELDPEQVERYAELYRREG